LAQLITDLLPTFTARTTQTPKHVFRIDFALNVKEARVIGSPIRLLEVRFISVGLHDQISAFTRQSHRSDVGNAHLVEVTASVWR
jgi:hypothetical protein